jgi:glycosyltransferase involved in cell wall biosynthesis
VTFVHFLTATYWPDRGGMETWVAGLARLLTRPGDRACVVYVRDSRPPDAGERSPGDARVVYFRRAKAELAPPALASVTAYPDERYRLDYLLFRNAVAEAVAAHPGDRHVLVSIYLSSSGFLAQHVAAELGLPHVACAAGSDLSADLHNPHRAAPIELVLRGAAHVVAQSGEQERWMRAGGLRRDGVTVIHNALPDDFPPDRWRLPEAKPLRLVCDTGYQFNKGTHVLFAAFRRLLGGGVDATLTVVGRTEAGNRAFWERERARLGAELGDRVRLLDWIEPSALQELRMGSHLYCSATLGEGCSLARLAALATGMPLVSTRCGELPDLAADLAHVRLAPPGSIDGLAAALDETARGLSRLAETIDGAALDRLRRHLTPARELAQWETVLRGVE